MRDCGRILALSQERPAGFVATEGAIVVGFTLSSTEAIVQ
jgi:hypothetical protein